MFPLMIGYDRRVEFLGYGIGWCDSCGRLEAARIVESQRKISVWFTPIDTTDPTRRHTCDLCGRSVSMITRPDQVTHWVHQEGLEILFERLSVDPRRIIDPDDRVQPTRALLSGLNEQDRPWRADYSNWGPAGFLVGGAVGLAAGRLLPAATLQAIGWERTRLTILLTVLAGLAGLGAVFHLHGVRGKRRRAVRAIRVAIGRGSIPADTLLEAARDVGGPASDAASVVWGQMEASIRRGPSA